MQTNHPSKISSCRPGVTKIELIVVLLILGILVAVIIPATQYASSGSREQRCKFYQQQLVEGMFAYVEQNEGRLPAYQSTIGEGEASWVVGIFEDIGQQDLAAAWQSGERPDPYVAHLVCPSDPVADPKTARASLSYLCNTRVCTVPEGMELDEIADGADATLLLGEGLRSKVDGDRQWTMTDEAEIGFGADGGITANLSSNHPEIVNVTYAGGKIQAMSIKIDPNVFRSLVLPDDAAEEQVEGDESSSDGQGPSSP